MTGKCRKGQYTTNAVVGHGALICHGGLGQPKCEHLEVCCQENGIKLRERRKLKACSDSSN